MPRGYNRFSSKTLKLFPKVVIKDDEKMVYINSKPTHIAKKTYLVLKVIHDANGKIVTRDELLNKVWGVDADIEIDTRSVDQHVSRLRRLIGLRIETHTGFGYRWNAKERK